MGENTSENCVVGEAAVGEHHHATQSGLGEELEGDGGEVSDVVDSDEELDYGYAKDDGSDSESGDGEGSDREGGNGEDEVGPEDGEEIWEDESGDGYALL